MGICISQTIRARAQEVWGKSDKNKGVSQSERKAAEMISYSKMPLKDDQTWVNLDGQRKDA